MKRQKKKSPKIPNSNPMEPHGSGRFSRYPELMQDFHWKAPPTEIDDRWTFAEILPVTLNPHPLIFSSFNSLRSRQSVPSIPGSDSHLATTSYQTFTLVLILLINLYLQIYKSCLPRTEPSTVFMYHHRRPQPSRLPLIPSLRHHA